MSKAVRRAKLAIVGSRDFRNVRKFEEKISEWIEKHGKPALIISGGASGADRMARVFAKRKNIAYREFRADWKEFGKAAGPIRNSLIVEACTHVLAFPEKGGTGTQDTMKKAKGKKKHLTVCWVN